MNAEERFVLPAMVMVGNVSCEPRDLGLGVLQLSTNRVGRSGLPVRRLQHSIYGRRLGAG